MSCAAFDVLAVRLARDEDLPSALREEALTHARSCPACAARLEEERAVTAALAGLAARTADAEAPARVEWALRGALRETLGDEHRPRRRAGLLRSAKVALLAAAAVLVVLAVMPRSGARTGSGPRARTMADPAGTAAASGFGPEFVSLGYPEVVGEMDSLHVLQIELPRSALGSFGWPSGEPQAGPVTAEVIVGHDGVARAIRLVE